PGEFQNISEVRFDADGNIYLNDLANRRISFLTREGDFIKGIKVPDVFEGLIINSKGFFIANITEILQQGQVSKWDLVYGLFDGEFNLIEEFFRLPQESKAPGNRNADSIAEFLAKGLSRMAFKPAVNYILDKKNRIFFGYSENYEIKVYSPEGKPIRKIQCDFDPIEITEENKKDFLKEHGESFMSVMPERTRHLKNKIFRLVQYPKYKPAYKHFILMENCWIFVVVDSAGDEDVLVDIFDKEGRYIARFETAIATDWLSFNNGKAYAVATAGDYKVVKRYDYEVLGHED
ncbi:MAG: hypothetical protein JXB23_07900, partial [Candidatus Aminicenantes bacterium]|nr:hypothetical protein [Candidatus Aminicenantes bacterium]